ncbi:unnamed protein product [Closterium sp. Naga37s-1]|nr:unnamed protein product [Closterium sp. Naga37s-1]
MLGDIFSALGPLEGCKLIRKDKSSYGFVDFYDHRSAQAALITLNGRLLFGQPIKVNWAYASTNREDTSTHVNIFVGDLGPEVTDASLFAAFSTFPSCSDARVMWDHRTGRSRGYGFVSFRSQLDAEAAIAEMTGKWVGTRPIRCNWATKNQAMDDASKQHQQQQQPVVVLPQQQQQQQHAQQQAASQQAVLQSGPEGADGGANGSVKHEPKDNESQGAAPGVAAAAAAAGAPGTVAAAAAAGAVAAAAGAGGPGTTSSAQFTTVYVGNLASEVSQTELHRQFYALGVGIIEEVRVQRDKGFGFVRYRTHEEAAAAIQAANGRVICGKSVKCSWGSKPTPPSATTTPGGLPPPPPAPPAYTAPAGAFGGPSAADLLAYQRLRALMPPAAQAGAMPMGMGMGMGMAGGGMAGMGGMGGMAGMGGMGPGMGGMGPGMGGMGGMGGGMGPGGVGPGMGAGGMGGAAGGVPGVGGGGAGYDAYRAGSGNKFSTYVRRFAAMWSAAAAPAGPRGPLVTFGDLVGDLTAEETRERVDRGDFDDSEGGIQERGKLRHRRRRRPQQQQLRGESGDGIAGSSAPSLLPRPASPPVVLPASPHAARASHVTRHMLLSSFEASLDDFRSSLSEPGHAWTRFTAQHHPWKRAQAATPASLASIPSTSSLSSAIKIFPSLPPSLLPSPLISLPPLPLLPRSPLQMCAALSSADHLLLSARSSLTSLAATLLRLRLLASRAASALSLLRSALHSSSSTISPPLPHSDTPASASSPSHSSSAVPLAVPPPRSLLAQHPYLPQSVGDEVPQGQERGQYMHREGVLGGAAGDYDSSAAAATSFAAALPPPYHSVPPHPVPSPAPPPATIAPPSVPAPPQPVPIAHPASSSSASVSLTAAHTPTIPAAAHSVSPAAFDPSELYLAPPPVPPPAHFPAHSLPPTAPLSDFNTAFPPTMGAPAASAAAAAAAAPPAAAAAPPPMAAPSSAPPTALTHDATMHVSLQPLPPSMPPSLPPSMPPSLAPSMPLPAPSSSLSPPNPTLAPPLSAPPLSAPPLSAPPLSAPPLSAPPLSAPPLSAPPLSAPPLSAPPLSAPPLSAPPLSAPPLSAPPLSAPPSAPPVSSDQAAPPSAPPVAPLAAPPIVPLFSAPTAPAFFNPSARAARPKPPKFFVPTAP